MSSVYLLVLICMKGGYEMTVFKMENILHLLLSEGLLG